ncbi:MAG: peptidase C11 [Firmicutes bacterium]|nr:peptidase C11 [Bacillota bacterium]
MANRPRGREQNITGSGKSVHRRGSGLGTGPVGNAGGYAGRDQNNGSGHGQGGGRGSNSGSQMQRSSGRRISPLLIIAILAFLVLGGGGAGLSSLFGGNTDTQSNVAVQQQSGNSLGNLGNLGSLLGNFSGGNVSSGWSRSANTGALDTTVSAQARSKRTNILGNGRDTVTIMVYMCGADLESRGGMATSDLQEMASANLGDKVNLLVYTGGASRWQNNVVSNRTNQIYKIEKQGSMSRLESDLGSVAMTKPGTLTGFIQYCNKKYPANRNILIFWDHGGGSITGYGYDEKFASSGAMSLKGIDQALQQAGVTFDFIGFDACLMGTVENALMLSSYADYLIASEETEPGIGWYYTNWLNKLASDTATPTIEIGKIIVDDFTSTCASRCAGQKTTLSVVDLAELERTVPQELSDFASSTLNMLQDNQYQTVSNARSSAREFASSNRVDQVDLVSLADKLGNKACEDLAKAILGAVKYNRTSSNMTDAYGLSIYFPYQKISTVNSAVKAYEDIGMDDDYTACIRKFASMEVGGQAASGGSASPLATLLGSAMGGNTGGSSGSSGSGVNSADMIMQLLGGLLGGNMGNVAGLTSGNASFLGKGLDVENDAAYLAENSFDASQLRWQKDADGTPLMYLSEEQWGLVQNLELNVFIDDGEGYIDLGLDNVFDFTDDGGLIGTYSGTWLAIDQQPVAYYHMDTVDDGETYSITGRVPAMLNGERVNLILIFDSENPHGYIAGAEPVYAETQTQTVSKAMLQLQDGDVIDFLCDYYSYDGDYQDSYYLGEQYVVNGTPEISDVYVDAEAASAVYRFTDIYQQHYWSPVME